MPTNVHIGKAMVFPVVMYGWESWTIKKAERWRIDAFKLWCWRRLLRFPWTARRSSQSILKENQPWILSGRSDAETEDPILWLSDAKSWLTRKHPDAGKDWRQEEKGLTEDALFGWHHRLNGQEFEQALGDGEGQGSLVCCSPWGHKLLNRTQWLNNNNKLSFDNDIKETRQGVKLHIYYLTWKSWSINIWYNFSGLPSWC